MSTRVRCLVYSHGSISPGGVCGVMFQSERKKVITLSSDITFDRLKELIREKLMLSPLEEITSIVYRLPVSFLNPGYVYTTFILSDDDDVNSMMETHIEWMVNTMLELYVEVSAGNTFDLNTALVPMETPNFICPPTVREAVTENFASSSGFRPLFGGGVDNTVGYSMEPSSSRQTIDSDDDEDYTPAGGSSSSSEDESVYSSIFANSGEEMGDFDEEMDDFDEDMDDAADHRNNDVEDDRGVDAVPASETLKSRQFDAISVLF